MLSYLNPLFGPSFIYIFISFFIKFGDSFFSTVSLYLKFFNPHLALCLAKLANKYNLNKYYVLVVCDL